MQEIPLTSCFVSVELALTVHIIGLLLWPPWQLLCAGYAVPHVTAVHNDCWEAGPLSPIVHVQDGLCSCRRHVYFDSLAHDGDGSN